MEKENVTIWVNDPVADAFLDQVTTAIVAGYKSLRDAVKSQDWHRASRIVGSLTVLEQMSNERELASVVAEEVRV